MRYSLVSGALTNIETPCLMVGLFRSGKLKGEVQRLDKAMGGSLQALLKSGDVSARPGECEVLHEPSGIKAKRLLIVGLGREENFTESRFITANLAANQRLNRLQLKSAANALALAPVASRNPAWRVRMAAQTAGEAAYRYSETVKPRENLGKAPAALRFVAPQSKHKAGLKRALDQAAGTVAGINCTRRLGDLPPNICTPAFLASEARKLARRHDNIDVKVLDKKALLKMGAGALMGVAQGSRNDPRLITFQFRGAAKSRAPHALVGKGVCFDSGGISLKPAPAMDEMKFDMCGAASVFGAFEALGHLQPKLNVIGVVAAVENMPDGNAYRPGDVVTSLSGQTVEILNTDAEGRMILCDALTYTERFKPASVVDIATLTGACVIALGKQASGLMSKHDDLADELLAASDESFDRAWRLPLWDEYQEQLDTNFADMANVGNKEAGAITAGCFLSRFTRAYRWAHLDVAGTAWLSGKLKGATGRPVPLLVQYLLDRAG